MSPDLLDDLLDRSASVTRAARDADLGGMIAEARRAARSGPRNRRHGMRIGLAAGVAALLVAGGGVAVAGGLIEWGPEFDDPDNAFAFALPSGRECESRLIADTPAGDPGPDQDAAAAIAAALRDWLSSTDVWSSLDLASARAWDETMAQEDPRHTVVIGADGTLTDIQRAPETRTEDDVYAFVVNRALGAALDERRKEFGPAGETVSANVGIRCAAVAP